MSKRDRFIRFATSEIDPDSQEGAGIFCAAYSLLDSHSLASEFESQLQQALQWFRRNLDVPWRFSRSSRPHRARRAIGWFKPTAADHLATAREIVAVLECHGIATTRLEIQQPGYVVYEDEYQVAAIPFADRAGSAAIALYR
jgi:hypothetical protein